MNDDLSKRVNMLRKLAWSFERTTNLEFEDLYQEALLAYWQAVNHPKYDARKSSLTTFIYIRVRNHLSSLATKNRKRHLPCESIESIEHIEQDKVGPEDATIFRDMLASLPGDAQLVLGIVFESPVDFLSLSCPTKRKREVIRRAEDRGLPKARTRLALSQIQSSIRA